ncbi:hypothetical protein L9F63_015711, partial [Diploptera punctata]
YKAIQSQRKNLRNISRLSCSASKSGQRLSGSLEHVEPRLSTIMPKMPVKTKSSQYTKLQESQESISNIPTAIRLKYQVGKIIGDGNFAVVRQCTERSTGGEFALKIIDKSKCHGKEHMIESEVCILRRVHHSNIIQLIAEYDTHSELYLVMELIKVSIEK